MNTIVEVPNKSLLEEVHQRIAPFIHKTPILTNQTINQLSGGDLYFKCENFQKIGAFKYRGATNAMLTLTASEKAKGVTTHSSGNHAQAVALSAANNGVKARIVMPENAPKVKVKAVQGYGAEIILCPPTSKHREEYMEAVIQEHGCTPIHPFDDYRIIAGQSTVAKETIEEIGNLDYIISPVGGGGLLSGTILSAQYFSPKTKVIAGEPEGADDAYQSFKAKKYIPCQSPNTIADGLLTSLGEKTYPIIQSGVEDIIRVNDEEIIAAMRLIWERMKIIVEPSAAVSLAVILKNKSLFRGKKTAIILTGGNVDLGKLPFKNE